MLQIFFFFWLHAFNSSILKNYAFKYCDNLWEISVFTQSVRTLESETRDNESEMELQFLAKEGG